MLAKRIIPCLDVKDGLVVKGVQFTNHRVVGSLIEMAAKYSADGADELVFYDIKASTVNETINKEWVSQISNVINIPFCVAGGIRSLQDAESILNMGADKISINTPALQNPEIIKKFSDAFGSQCVVIGIDVKTANGVNYIYSKTGNEQTSNKTDLNVKDWVEQVQEYGAGELVINTMNQDGMQNGYDIKLLQEIIEYSKIPIIASGGAGKLIDFKEVFDEARVDGALAASIFHEGEITVGEVKSYLNQQNIRVRF